MPPIGQAEASADVISDDPPILGKAVNAKPVWTIQPESGGPILCRVTRCRKPDLSAVNDAPECSGDCFQREVHARLRPTWSRGQIAARPAACCALKSPLTPAMERMNATSQEFNASG